MKNVLVVSATRLDIYSFFSIAPLGISLKRLAADTRLASSIEFLNSGGLPRVFNGQISEENRGRILLFIHDDVWIDDFFLVDRLLEAAQTFDVVGVAGNTRRLPRQPGWAFVNDRFEWDDPSYLTGATAYGSRPFGSVSFFGPTPRACRLLDGVFLAAPCDALLEKQVYFDVRFTFDFYDLDFCRTAEQRGLRLGSWPIAITHASAGGFDGPSWKPALARYLEKWNDTEAER